MYDKCRMCAYGKGKHCSVMTEWIENCFAYADNKEANRRAKDIRVYNSNEPDGKAKTTVQDRLKRILTGYMHGN